MEEQRIEVLGDGESAVFEHFDRTLLYPPERREAHRAPGAKGYRQEVHAFLGVVRTGEPISVPAEAVAPLLPRDLVLRTGVRLPAALVLA